MANATEKTLKQMYDEYLQTGDADWLNIDSVTGKQLEQMGFVTQNILGEFKLTSAGISYMRS